MMFSETACSMNRLGAMIGTLPPRAFVVEHAARAAPMVGVGVGEDDGGDRPLAAVLEVKLHRGPRALDRGQRIHHDHAAVALDQRHVGDVEPAHLVDAGHHFEQAVMHVEPRLPPQAGIDVGGACSQRGSRKGSRLQTTRPCGDMIFAFSTVPRKPRAASSKSRVSENGSAFSVAACCAMTEAEASFGGFRHGWLAHCCVLPCANKKSETTSAKLQPIELAAAAPPVDIFEVGHRSRRMARH
jgi:hypothetical protein